MEVRTLYLEAIQSIAGITPGEKQKTINAIARQLASVESDENHLKDIKDSVPDVLEPLRSLIRVEVSKILHQHDAIIEALKSDNPVVVARATQAKWFFDGSDTTLVNAQHFRDNVFPNVSLYARLKIVKNFGCYLKNTQLAAEFFLTIAELYGPDQAVPLLIACEEEFAFNMIIEKKILLSLKHVEVLYRKYPDLVVDYVKYRLKEAKSKHDYDVKYRVFCMTVHSYVKLLPEIAKTHFEDFMEIFEFNNYFDVKLCKKATKTFLKTRKNLLVKNPSRYLKILPLKEVTRKLSAKKFAQMFKNLFPENMAEFNYSDMNNILQYYKPAENRLSLILNTFREVYNIDLLDNENLVDYQLIKVLPAADRVKQARLKLENDADWHVYLPRNSWRCYLPIYESISLIKKEIVKTSDESRRGQMMRQLIHACKNNDDEVALLEVLNYLYDKHRNDAKHELYNSLSLIVELFNLATLSPAHWVVLNKYIKMAEMQGDLNDRVFVTMPVIEAAIQYCLLNDRPLENYLRLFLDMKTQNSNWSSKILSKYPRFEKILLELLIEEIPRQYPFENIEIWKKIEIGVIEYFTSSLWSFKKRNSNEISIKDYQWLIDKVKSRIFSENYEEGDSFRKSLLISIKKNEPNLYDLWLPELKKFWTFDITVICDVLRKHPQLVFSNWKECFEKIQSVCTPDDRDVSRFIRKSRWYQYLPINFFNESLKVYDDPKKSARTMFILMFLSDGQTYEKIIKPFIPDHEEINIEDPKAKEKYEILRAITKNMSKVNPPISLETITKFCVGDYLRLVIGAIRSVCYRIPVIDVMPFTRTLMDRRVTVMKHGIRLIRLVAPLEEVCTVLTSLWSMQGHPSIRKVIFDQIYNIFCKQPDSRIWYALRMCLNGLNAEDDEEIFKNFEQLSIVPNEYLCEYIETVLSTLKFVEKKSLDPKQYVELSCNVIQNIDSRITDILSEEYCQELIKNYLFVFDYNESIFNVGKDLTINSYLLVPGNHRELRYKFFKTFFRDTVRKYWNKSDPKSVQFYPINFMVKIFFQTIVSKTSERRDAWIFETLLDIFQSVLSPHQDAASYLGLVYSIEFHKSNNSKEFGRMMIKKVPKLLEIFSTIYITPISDELLKFLKERRLNEEKSASAGILDIIKIFANEGRLRFAFIATHMLLKNKLDMNDRQHKAVIDTLRNFDHPGVCALLNEHLVNSSCAKYSSHRFHW